MLLIDKIYNTTGERVPSTLGAIQLLSELNCSKRTKLMVIPRTLCKTYGLEQLAPHKRGGANWTTLTFTNVSLIAWGFEGGGGFFEWRYERAAAVNNRQRIRRPGSRGVGEQRNCITVGSRGAHHNRNRKSRKLPPQIEIEVHNNINQNRNFCDLLKTFATNINNNNIIYILTVYYIIYLKKKNIFFNFFIYTIGFFCTSWSYRSGI